MVGVITPSDNHSTAKVNSSVPRTPSEKLSTVQRKTSSLKTSASSLAVTCKELADETKDRRRKKRICPQKKTSNLRENARGFSAKDSP